MIQLQGVSKSYEIGGESVVGLQDVSMALQSGDFVCLRGASGSGKTTLLLTLGGMQRPTSGIVSVAGNDDLYGLNQAARTRIRARHIGFVFQLFHLVPYLNVLDNIRLGAVSSVDSRDEAESLIEKLGLQHRRRHKPSQLSVGECQRVAVARAFVSRPDVMLADEPTGNLDSDNAGIVISVLEDYCNRGGLLLLATHSDKPIDRVNRLLTIDGGVVNEQVATG